MCYIVYHKNRTSICHKTMVTVVCLQINRQECSMPIICNEHKISITIAEATTWNVPWNLYSRFAQQNHSFQDVCSVSTINFTLNMVEDRIVDENKIHAIYVCMVILYLHILPCNLVPPWLSYLLWFHIITIFWNYHHNTMTSPGQSLRQSSSNISKSTCFRPRSTLCSYQYDIHNIDTTRSR
uniref:Starch synthase IIc n=1 Tax=Arundo donax TaxID=35708 RepID=A0A0A9EHK9_ARUDO